MILKQNRLKIITKTLGIHAKIRKITVIIKKLIAIITRIKILGMSVKIKHLKILTKKTLILLKIKRIIITKVIIQQIITIAVRFLKPLNKKGSKLLPEFQLVERKLISSEFQTNNF